MLKALFLDMDDTLCDTQGANNKAIQLLARAFQEYLATAEPEAGLAQAYVDGIYRRWTPAQEARYMPIVQEESEESFRIQLIKDLAYDAHGKELSEEAALALQTKFDSDRLAAFTFYPGIEQFLIEARKYFTLVVITNGPEYSQIPKVEAVNLSRYVDHIVIGGQEPEQKPAASIFFKALRLAGCEAHEVVHVGDSLAADIQGAHNSGITSIWIQHQQPLDAELGINPHHTLVHPSEIPALIRRLHPF
ncbi:HAD-IA family hydrolase [Halioxenophilus sp. WMMB6]|uniref:HAD family hydrolase n=1 Tax=Halioxenophilus sp. WMMB6 TaxID=3073815 RepID=UPI00295F39F9|nr:HAD-IA family hydrolase [Halioxenophilus sp. WMMB6]